MHSGYLFKCAIKEVYAHQVLMAGPEDHRAAFAPRQIANTGSSKCPTKII